MLDAAPAHLNAEVCSEIEELHRRCGVYTRLEVVRILLDSIGWESSADLTDSRLLEPAAGNGIFVAEAAERLLKSLTSRGLKPSKKLLTARILAFEIHPTEAKKARRRVGQVLKAFGLKADDVASVVRSWVKTKDFLLAEIADETFSHIAGNPPYARWSKIPPTLREKYEIRLPRRMIRGDLFLPFLDLAIGYLKKGGRLGFVCSDRWRYMAFAEAFRETRLPQIVVERDQPLEAKEAYERHVDTYPSLLVVRRRIRTNVAGPAIRRAKKRTIRDMGYHVRVGPALGCTRAFVLNSDESDAEEGLLVPWLDGSEISDGNIEFRGRRVIAIYGSDGKLHNLANFPLAQARLQRHRDKLERRSIVLRGAPWYRPIDRVIAADWQRPKLLVPELAKTPRIALDESGVIPSHGVYAIFAPDDNLVDLYEQLVGGGLAKALDGLAPKVKGGYTRCYRRFLEKVPLSK